MNHIKWTVGSLAFLSLIVPFRLGATLQPLPLFVNAPTYGWNQFSGDGTAVLGIGPQNTYGRWTAGTGFVACPLTDKAVHWNQASHLSLDGKVVVGSGTVTGFTAGAFTWRVGQGVRDVAVNGKAAQINNIGVAADGGFVVRLETTNGVTTVFRDWTDKSLTVWFTLQPTETILSAAADGTRVIGTSRIGNRTVPCYWTTDGTLVVGRTFPGSHPCLPQMCSSDGKVIVGVVDLEQGNSLGLDTLTFRWDTVSNSVQYYSMTGFKWNSPGCLSPDGTVTQISFYNESSGSGVVLDQSTPVQQAKGFQDLTTWLLDQHYIETTDLANRRDFGMVALSNDRNALVGYYFQGTNDNPTYFISHRTIKN